VGLPVTSDTLERLQARLAAAHAERATVHAELPQLAAQHASACSAAEEAEDALVDFRRDLALLSKRFRDFRPGDSLVTEERELETLRDRARGERARLAGQLKAARERAAALAADIGQLEELLPAAEQKAEAA
jgi:chromosome segregation ATPase